MMKKKHAIRNLRKLLTPRELRTVEPQLQSYEQGYKDGYQAAKLAQKRRAFVK